MITLGRLFYFLLGCKVLCYIRSILSKEMSCLTKHIFILLIFVTCCRTPTLYYLRTFYIKNYNSMRSVLNKYNDLTWLLVFGIIPQFLTCINVNTYSLYNLHFLYLSINMAWRNKRIKIEMY